MRSGMDTRPMVIEPTTVLYVYSKVVRPPKKRNNDEMKKTGSQSTMVLMCHRSRLSIRACPMARVCLADAVPGGEVYSLNHCLIMTASKMPVRLMTRLENQRTLIAIWVCDGAYEDSEAAGFVASANCAETCSSRVTVASVESSCSHLYESIRKAVTMAEYRDP